MRGLYITSKNNNSYFYNDETGIIEVVGYERDEHIYYNKEYKPKIVTKEDVKENLFNSDGFKSLILEVSQDCNLKCKCCIFDTLYKNIPSLSNKLMTIDTAKKAIDYFVNNLKSKNYINPLAKINIGFYGGEPLINFPVIKESVKYIKNNYSHLNFFNNIITNGVLLNNEIGDFLVANNFSIIISLDGDKKNHNRNRVNTNGIGSFDEVFENIQNFIKRHPNYDSISINGCYDYKTDLINVSEFYNKNNLYVSNLTFMPKRESNYFNEFTEEDKVNFYKKYTILENRFMYLLNNKGIDEFVDSYEMSLIGNPFITFQLHPVHRFNSNDLIPFTTPCTPGNKLYVDVNEKFHICERINNNFSIGDLDNGLNFNRISEIINEYNKKTIKCSKCNISKLCTRCLASSPKNNNLEVSKEKCEEIISYQTNLIKKYINIMEETPDKFEALLKTNFIQLNKKTNTTFCL